MKFKLRKVSGLRGTEIKVSVFFETEETDIAFTAVRDDTNVRLESLRIPGDDYLKADHALMILRSLVHYSDLWRLRDNPAIAKYLTHGVMRRELVEEAQKPKRKKRKRK